MCDISQLNRCPPSSVGTEHWTGNPKVAGLIPTTVNLWTNSDYHEQNFYWSFFQLQNPNVTMRRDEETRDEAKSEI